MCCCRLIPRPAALALVLLAVLAGSGSSAYASDVTWEDVESRVRAALRGQLSASATERLLARADVRSALAEAFAYDVGSAELVTPPVSTLSVRRAADGTLVVEVVTRAQQRICSTEIGHREGLTVDRDCQVLDVELDDRRVSFAPELLKPPSETVSPTLAPETPPPRRRRPPRRVPEVTPPSEPLPTIMRSWRDTEASAQKRLLESLWRPVPEMATANNPAGGLGLGAAAVLARHLDFKDTMKASRWTDPLLPTDLVAAGLRSPDPAPKPHVREDPSSAHLRDPFGPGRMDVDLPPPYEHRLSRDEAVTPKVRWPDEPCVAAWGARGNEAPPSLDCVRRISHSGKLDRSELFQLAKTLATFMSTPLWGMLMELEMNRVATSKAHGVMWSLAWLDWVSAHPESLAERLSELTDEERVLLRRRSWRWWIDRRFVTYHASLTTIYERHFLTLYPEARGRFGLPKRRFFRDDWLWASNWLTLADGQPPDLVVRAYDELSGKAQAILDTLASDESMALRFPRSSRLLRQAAH